MEVTLHPYRFVMYSVVGMVCNVEESAYNMLCMGWDICRAYPPNNRKYVLAACLVTFRATRASVTSREPGDREKIIGQAQDAEGLGFAKIPPTTTTPKKEMMIIGESTELQAQCPKEEQ